MKKKIVKMQKQPAKSAELSNLNKFLRIVSDENRLRILLTLKGGSMNVTEIHTKLRLPQNLTSHHISRLKSIGLLGEKSEGTFRHYTLNVKKIREYQNIFKKMLGA